MQHCDVIVFRIGNDRLRFCRRKVGRKPMIVGKPVIQRFVSRYINDDRWTSSSHAARHLPVARPAMGRTQNDRGGQVSDVDAQFQSARCKNTQARAVA
jgi:hypothetical protein